jgi:phosphoribosylformylglycinamidine synthase
MQVKLSLDGEKIAKWDWQDLMRAWSETSHAMQRLRDNPRSADEELEWRCDATDPGITPRLAFDPAVDVAAPYVARGARPRVAILREQGVNGQVEMAAAFSRAGFDAVDVHLSDLASGRRALGEFHGFAACGGCSYGDVLGAGRGWAASILYNERLREQFARFLADDTRFTLGVCNGCQMLAQLKSIIPGAEGWPRFVQNRSTRFEARLSLVQVEESPTLFFRGLAGARLPIAVAHGEGRVEPARPEHLAALEANRQVALRYVRPDGSPATRYPENPNGSPGGITGLTTPDGRVTILMPHPERVIRTAQLSWHPEGWPEDSPWLHFFRNARAWVG